MKKIHKALVRYTVKEFLFTFIDLGVTLFEISDIKHLYKRSIYEYKKNRDLSSEKFSQLIYRLKKQGIIEDYFENGDRCIELSEKGLKKIKTYLFDDYQIKKTDKWDHKWRLVIFDIPDEIRKARDALRKKLKELGFIKLQESVFVYPYECRDLIDYIKSEWDIKPYVIYLEADRIETEIDLINEFCDNNIILNV